MCVASLVSCINTLDDLIRFQRNSPSWNFEQIFPLACSQKLHWIKNPNECEYTRWWCWQTKSLPSFWDTARRRCSCCRAQKTPLRWRHSSWMSRRIVECHRQRDSRCSLSSYCPRHKRLSSTLSSPVAVSTFECLQRKKILILSFFFLPRSKSRNSRSSDIRRLRQSLLAVRNFRLRTFSAELT